MNKFKIIIGDRDGDGERKEFLFESNKSIEEVRAAYLKSKEKYPEICPENFCNCDCDYLTDYDSEQEIYNVIRSLTFETMKNIGLPKSISEKIEANYEIKSDGYHIFYEDLFIDIVVWFICLLDKEIIIKNLEPEKIETLNFYSRDDKGNFTGIDDLGKAFCHE